MFYLHDIYKTVRVNSHNPQFMNCSSHFTGISWGRALRQLVYLRKVSIGRWVTEKVNLLSISE